MVETPSLNDVAADTQRRISEGSKNVVSAVGLKHKDDGSAEIPVIGVKIPSALVPFAEWGYDWAITPITEGLGNFVHKGVYRLSTELLQKNPELAHKYGMAGRIGASILLLGSKPIGKLFNSAKQYRADSGKIKALFRPVMDATGANADNNEMIGNEFKAVYSDAIDNLKTMLPDLPMLAVQSVILYEGYQENEVKFKNEVEESLRDPSAPRDVVAERLAKDADAAKKIDEKIIIKERLDNKVKADQDAFLKNPASDKYGKSDEEKIAYFQNEFAKDTREEELKAIKKEKENALKAKSILKNPQAVVAGASTLARSASVAIEQDTKSGKRKKYASAIEMVANLRVSVLEQCTDAKKDEKDFSSCNFIPRIAEEVFVEPLENQEIRKKMNLQQYVFTIFAQHEVDSGRIDENGQALLTDTQKKALFEASGTIADSIADGTLDANGVVELVGRGEIFPHTGNKRTVASKEALNSTIAKLTVELKACRQNDSQDFWEQFEKSDAAKEVLKTQLNDPSMSKEEKAALEYVLGYDVMKDLGASHKEISSSFKLAHDQMYKLIETTMHQLVTESKDKFKGVNQEQLDTLLKYANQVEAGNPDAYKYLVDGPGRKLLRDVIGAAVVQELQTDKNAWVARVRGNPVKDRAAIADITANDMFNGEKTDIANSIKNTGFADGIKQSGGSYVKSVESTLAPGGGTRVV